MLVGIFSVAFGYLKWNGVKFILKLLSKLDPGMKIISKVDDYDTISDSKQVVETPRSAPVNFKREKVQKKLSLIDHLDESPRLWKQSSSSLSRERSPSHKIPNASRFLSVKEEQNKNGNFLTLNLRGEIGVNSIKFPQSKRPEHFICSDRVHTPSPATYNCSRFLQETHSTILQRQTSLKNPEAVSSSGKAVKGISIPSFNSYHKSYIDHAKHSPYQPQTTEGNPGPGSYNNSWATKRRNKSYTIRIALKKFNETTVVNPGPGAYSPYRSERISSSNMKGTIPNSHRTYLTKFQKFPSPQSYHISRFLDQYS